MLKVITVLCFVLIIDRNLASKKYDGNDVGEPLFLSPLIQHNKINEARTAAKVSLVGARNIVSYSGYLTVDVLSHSYLFFWFFPSKSDYRTDPVIIWLQGGPGSSSLVGLFLENGPFLITDNLELQLRNISWINYHSVLYIDNPVGTGFSYTFQKYADGQRQIKNQLYVALLQFFQMFPEIEENDIFIAGQSYAARYILNIGKKIMEERESSVDRKINLKGLIIGDGFVDPINQLKYGDFLYDHGLINEHQRNELYQLENEIVKLIRGKRYLEAAPKMDLLLFKWKQLSGLKTNFDYVHDEILFNLLENMENYLNHKTTRIALHVGNMTFNDKHQVMAYLQGDRTKSEASLIPELLSNYRILIYTGQLDVSINYIGVTNYLEHLKLDIQYRYKSRSRRPWYVGMDVAGYVKVIGNLTEVMVRNAGHLVPKDQPLWALDMITKFIRNLI